MATVIEIINRASDLMSREIKSSSLATFPEESALRWLGDAYNEVHRILHLPLKKAVFDMTASSPDKALPTDIYNGSNGIMQLTYRGQVVKRVWRDPHLMQYGNMWQNPPGAQPAAFWMEYDSHQSIRLVPWAITSTGSAFEMIYVEDVTEPATTGATIPPDFVAYISVFPSYLVGRFLQKQKDQRAASFLGEFQGRLADVNRRNKRQGRRNAGEAYTVNLGSYYQNVYGRRTY